VRFTWLRAWFACEVRDWGRAGGNSGLNGAQMARTRQQRTHLDTARVEIPSGDGCQECLAMGDTWVHLRRRCFSDELEVFV
jgi:hypothetical protein